MVHHHVPAYFTALTKNDYTNLQNCLNTLKETRSSAVTESPCDASCLSVVSTIPHAASASDLPLHAIKFCSVLFGLPIEC